LVDISRWMEAARKQVQFTILLDICYSYSYVHDLCEGSFSVGEHCCLVSR